MKKYLLPEVKRAVSEWKNRTAFFVNKDRKALEFHNPSRISIDLKSAERLVRKLEQRGIRVSREDKIVIANSVALSDVGHEFGRKGHELRSIEVARKLLAGHPLLEKISKGVMATHPDTQPEGVAQQVIRDCDYENFSKWNDFTKNNELLKREFGISNAENARFTMDILKSLANDGRIRYSTPLAREVWLPLARENFIRYHRRLERQARRRVGKGFKTV